MPLATDDLVTDEDRASQPSEAGTYTLRLDSDTGSFNILDNCFSKRS